MAFTRKSLADHLDSYDAEISALQDSKRETLSDYRAELAEKGFGKAQIKDEIEALKRAMRRRRAIAKTSEAEVEEADALADEIFIEITGPAPRATPARENIEEFPPHSPETGELTDTQEQPETATQPTHPRHEDHRGVETAEVEASAPHSQVGENVSTSTAARNDAGKRGVTAGETASHSPSPANAPRLAADDEAAQANPTSSATLSSSVAPPPPGETDKAGDVPPPSSPAASFNNPRCKHPGTCSHAHDQGSCDDCFFDWAKRPLDEQRRLWAEAMEAASETEAV